MMSPMTEIEISRSEDSFDFDTTPIPFDVSGGPMLHGAAAGQQRAVCLASEGEWIKNDADSLQSWLSDPQGWFEQTANVITSCCQILPDAFMPSFSFELPTATEAKDRPRTPASSTQTSMRHVSPTSEWRSMRSSHHRSPSSRSTRQPSKTSEWRNMRSSCYDASSRSYRSIQGNDHGERERQHGAPLQQRDHSRNYSTDTAHDQDSPQIYTHSCYPSYEEYSRRSFQSQASSSTPTPREYSYEYREPAPMTPAPSFPRPNEVKRASVEELYETNSVCDDSNVLRPNDVVCGRGSPIQSHRGNSAFRNIISEYQTAYLCARRFEKPRIADQVLNEVRKSGGRFVRRAKKEPRSRGTGVGAVSWEEIDDKKALQNICLELRNGAPELQRQMLASSR